MKTYTVQYQDKGSVKYTEVQAQDAQQARRIAEGMLHAGGAKVMSVHEKR